MQQGTLSRGNTVPIPRKHRPLDILRYHLVENEVVASLDACRPSSNPPPNVREVPSHSGVVATPQSLYQASFTSRHAAPSPDLLDDAPQRPNGAQLVTATHHRSHGGGGGFHLRKVPAKSRSLNANPRHAVTTRHQTLDELLDDNRRAVHSCTPHYKEKHLRRNPPLPTPSLLPQSTSSPAVTASPTSPVVLSGGVEVGSAGRTSTYRQSFPTSHAHNLDDDNAAGARPAAGKRLPRDSHDTSNRPFTSTSTSRVTFPAHSAEEYQHRSREVLAASERVQKRLEAATEYARRHSNGPSGHGDGAPPLIEGLYQASYKAPPKRDAPPPRRNPELVQAAAAVRERGQAGYFKMDVTSTQRGDFSVGQQLKKRAIASSSAGGGCGGGATQATPQRRAASVGLVASSAPLRYVNASTTAAQEALSLPGAVLTLALDAMSTELADPPAYRAQSSCEIIMQRKTQYPGAAIHTPAAQCTGPDVINRRAALDAQYKHKAAGFSFRPSDAPRPTMHTCSEIFGTAPAVTGLSLSQASYRPFQFV